MKTYIVKYNKQAEKDLFFWRKNSKVVYRTIQRLVAELEIHPTWGTGNPKTLRSDRKKWAREINKKDRLIYTIKENIVTVEVLSARGHYDDH